MNEEAQTIKVFLVDDHPVFREGLRVLLENEPRLKVVGEAANGEEVLKKLKNQVVDVLVLDIDMPEMNGLELIAHIEQFPSPVHVLVFSMYDDENYIQYMMKKGVKGYILKSCRKDELIRAIETVNAGDSYLGKEVSEKLIRSIQQKEIQAQTKESLPLTKREIEVIKLVATGRTNLEIGQLLHISHRTVDTHRRNIMEKLNLHNAAALTHYAAKKGLLDTKE